MPLEEEILSKIRDILSTKFNRSTSVIKATLTLFNEGNTIPFIARYRKDTTKALDEVELRDLQKEYNTLVNLEERRLTILKSIMEQGKLTGELEGKIKDATTLAALEDLYLPYKPKRQTKAQKAREAGLEPLANTILFDQPVEGQRESIIQGFINEEKGYANEKDVLKGAMDIIMETIAEEADLRTLIREITEQECTIKSREIDDSILQSAGESNGGDGHVDEPGEKTNRAAKQKYKDYFSFDLDIRKIKPHQVLALNRGENEGFLDVELATEDEQYIEALNEDLIHQKEGLFAPELEKSIKRGYNRASRTIKRETWVSKIMEAKTHAIKVFAENLKNLLLQPPLKGKRIIAIDPGFRNGCKIAVIDENGGFLDKITIYPHPPQKRMDESKKMLLNLAEKNNAWTIAIGNGTASRETETMVAEIAQDHEKMEYTIVSEAGASVYSASDVAREEFPDLDVSIRGSISIARRLQDPLSELIKIDPKSIGVGLYQHDVNQTELNDELNNVIEYCVNSVGVDVNTASTPLLKHVSGLNSRAAREIVKHRKEHGPFSNRKQIKDVKFVGDKTYEQAIGFLKIHGGENPLDTSFIHPESYEIASEILKSLDLAPKDLLDHVKLAEINKRLSHADVIKKFRNTCGEETLKDIIEALKAPRRDPRDDLPEVILRKDVIKTEDLEPGMILRGTVRNVLDFGAFVDIGVKYNGLVHISQIANKFVKNPHDFLKTGDIVDVMIVSVDLERKRIQLSIKEAINATRTKQ
ncbi:MAG: Tex family protein [Promethearchaeota archaeon]